VRIEFDLFTRFDQQRLGEPSKSLGILPVEVKNISGRTVRNFAQPLPYPAGIGLKSLSECRPPKSAPTDMKILSFTITPASIVLGQTATLQWQTENSETVQVGVQNPEVIHNQRAERILKPRTVESSGSLQVTPSQTTTYALKATKGALSSYPQSVTVTVTNPPPPPQGFCAIFGKVSNDQREYATTIGIYRAGDSRRAVLTTRVRMGGEYSIRNVPVGEYDVIPRGSYPSSKMDIGPNPRARRIVCQPAGSHPANFKIQSNEG
jgi:hypothetical protein